MFVGSPHSLRSLAPQHSTLLARSIHGLAHSLRSLPRGVVEILKYVLTLKTRFTGTNAFFIFPGNTPLVRPRLSGGIDLARRQRERKGQIYEEQAE